MYSFSYKIPLWNQTEKISKRKPSNRKTSKRIGGTSQLTPVSVIHSIPEQSIPSNPLFLKNLTSPVNLSRVIPTKQTLDPVLENRTNRIKELRESRANPIFVPTEGVSKVDPETSDLFTYEEIFEYVNMDTTKAYIQLKEKATAQRKGVAEYIQSIVNSLKKDDPIIIKKLFVMVSSLMNHLHETEREIPKPDLTIINKVSFIKEVTEDQRAIWNTILESSATPRELYDVLLFIRSGLIVSHRVENQMNSTENKRLHYKKIFSKKDSTSVNI